MSTTYYSVKQIESALRNGREVEIVWPSKRPEYSNNGGEYEFRDAFRKNKGEDTVTPEYWNSSEFNYCRNCGRFGNDDCHPEVQRLEKAARRIFDCQGDLIGKDEDGREVRAHVEIEGLEDRKSVV